MRAAVGVLLGLAFNVVFIAALIARFKPLPKLKMPTRKHALYGLGLSFVLLVLWVIVMPAPEQKAGDSADEKVVAKEASAAAPDPEQAKAREKADVIAFYKSVLGAVRSCDNAAGKVAVASEKGDVVGVYRAAQDIETACLSTPSDIADVEIPKSVDDARRKKLREVREVCKQTYLLRWTSGKKIKDMIDSNGSIKAQAAMQETAELQQTGIMLCTAGLAGEAMAVGATEEELRVP